MRRLKLLGLALVAVFASAGALSTSAFALELPENLPASTTRTWVGLNVGTLQIHFGRLLLECGQGRSEGTEETSKPPKGSFHITLEKCILGKSACTGLGDAAGVILMLGTWHLVWDRLKGGTFEDLTTAILFLSNAMSTSCGEWLPGETLCLYLHPTMMSATHELHCLGKITEGTPEPIEEWCKKDLAGVCSEPVVPSLRVGKNTPILLLGLGTMTALQGGKQQEIFADQ